jgi:pyruvate-ferredoxin/flavodoxin oxidoreductase
MSKIMKTMDGNAAASYVSYAFTDVAAIYPITPSSNMAQNVDEWAAAGKKNLFGQEVLVSEMQSEAGAAGAVHGSLQAGALTTTYTASQGLLLMIPNMYKIAGELLPCVFHVSARALAAQALSIFGDHQDVMAVRQTGFAMLASGSVQEVMDLGGIAHLATIKSRVPFLHFFDGFRTSHEVQKIEAIDYKEFDRLLDREALYTFRNNSLNPERPVTRGTAQNPDIYFQSREASNKFYDAVPAIVVDYMKEISTITGRDYKPFNYYGAPDADRIIIAMGSVVETIEETIDYLVARGEKVGMIKVRLYRPFVAEYFFDVVPATVKKIAVLDRTKEPGAIGEPLYMDIRSIYYDRDDQPKIVGGRYGLGSKDTTPSQIKAVYDMLTTAPKHNFTVGIEDDVTNLSIPVVDNIVTEVEGTVRCKFWGLGSDGTVGANKNAIKIIGDKTNLYAQGYFAYDSKKSGGVTVSHLRFGKSPIRSTYLIDESDYVACHTQAYVNQYDITKGLKKGGNFVLNCIWDDAELEKHLPANVKRYIAKNEINFYTINATKIAEDIGLGNRINMIMQSAFFKLANVIALDDAVKYLNEAIVKSYGSKGEKIVSMNKSAVEAGINNISKVNVPASWATAVDEKTTSVTEPDFITKVLRPMSAQEGDYLPVSTFNGREDGTFEHGTSAYEKRGIAVNVPEWQIENCIQCNQCSFVCPHAAIRPFMLDAAEQAKAPATFETKPAMGKEFEGHAYRIQVSTMDCTGCGNCADICPSKVKSLIMKPIETQVGVQMPNWDFAVTVEPKDKLTKTDNVKGSQFAQPLFEFSGACAGCGETPYMKVITQLYGDRMMIANATGCSSIWGASAPSTPYCKNNEGKGPAWANSLFEDTAEYGYGMLLGAKQIRGRLEILMTELVSLDLDEAVKAPFTLWLSNQESPRETQAAAEGILRIIANNDITDAKALVLLKEIEMNKDYIIKKSQWIVGGDGWAYDIGYGGLDHVLASGENINILVFDTEVYSNTGGQASKSTPTAAVAQFAASGMKIKKKDLGMIATTYGYIYVAQVAMGSNKNQFMKALIEAESYDGPSLLICYAPCIAHGIKEGMGRTQYQQKRAVDAGYWHLWRFDPRLKEQGKNPFVLDSAEPKESFRDFIMSEVRYTTLIKAFPEKADLLFERTEAEAKERYKGYVRMTQMEF